MWKEVASESAAPERVLHFGEQLNRVIGGKMEGSYAKKEIKMVLGAVFAGSPALSEILLSHHDWIEVLDPQALKIKRKRPDLLRETDGIFKNSDLQDGLTLLRAFKQKEMLRIAARDLARFADVSVITEELSNVADVCLKGVTELCLENISKKFGAPFSTDPNSHEWQPATFCVLGMGKLGGQELNYSSDIDVLFVYSGEGFTFKGDPAKNSSARGIPNNQFFARLAEAIIAECTRMTAEGFLFRIDLRLRPEGKTSPLARSLDSYENYYAQWGQTWERMMLIKARGVAGDEGLAAEFLEMVHPFRYPRSISEQIPREVAEMKARIENEVVRSGELDRNVKLGRGGIREIEFLVQTLQVLHAGKMPFLQGGKTLPLLDKLAEYHLLEQDSATRLKEAYCFLRDVEHRLQMENNQQTHTIPVDPAAQTRLARLMGFPSYAKFEKQLRQHNTNVRTAYEKFISPEASKDELKLPRDIEANLDQWRAILERHSFRDATRCVKLVREFIEGPDFGHRSSRTIDHSFQLMNYLLRMCPQKDAPAPPQPFLSDPDRVLARLDAFVSRYGASAMLYDAWVTNPSLFRLLLLAFDRSEFLAELAIRQPDLIDEIEQSGQLRRRKTSPQILEDLRHGSKDEDQHSWMRRYFQADQMRIGLRDILDLATPEQTQFEISELADAFLSYALEVVLRQNRLKKAPFAIIGLGKLGGHELIYASDLDIIFVAPDKARNLPAVQKLAVQLLDLLSRRTEHGTTFATDARLRPDGDKGLLVNTLSSYSDYYRKRALLWEIQSLSRFRPITGDPSVCQKFEEMALGITDFRKEGKETSAYSEGWKGVVDHMRIRIEKERTPPGKGRLAIKTGEGGLMDVEFIAQALCLEHGWHEPNTLGAIAKAELEGKLSKKSASALSENYRKLIQIERILRRWSFEPESFLPEDEPAYYRVAVRCGFRKTTGFETALQGYRSAIREEYLRYFHSKPKSSEAASVRKITAKKREKS